MSCSMLRADIVSFWPQKVGCAPLDSSNNTAMEFLANKHVEKMTQNAEALGMLSPADQTNSAQSCFG